MKRVGEETRGTMSGHTSGVEGHLNKGGGGKWEGCGNCGGWVTLLHPLSVWKGRGGTDRRVHTNGGWERGRNVPCIGHYQFRNDTYSNTTKDTASRSPLSVPFASPSSLPRSLPPSFPPSICAPSCLRPPSFPRRQGVQQGEPAPAISAASPFTHPPFVQAASRPTGVATPFASPHSSRPPFPPPPFLHKRGCFFGSAHPLPVMH